MRRMIFNYASIFIYLYLPIFKTEINYNLYINYVYTFLMFKIILRYSIYKHIIKSQTLAILFPVTFSFNSNYSLTIQLTITIWHFIGHFYLPILYLCVLSSSPFSRNLIDESRSRPTLRSWIKFLRDAFRSANVPLA